MGILDNLKKNLKDQLETNVSIVVKGLERFGAGPQASASQAVNASFCPECGTRVEAGGGFCPSCGAAVSVQSGTEAVSSSPTPPPPPIPLNPALAEHRRTTIFDFILYEKKVDREGNYISSGKFVVEGVFSFRTGTELSFYDPEDAQSKIMLTLNKRPPELERGQKATVYFHCEGHERILDELVLK
jgi:hypothetical protein